MNSINYIRLFTNFIIIKWFFKLELLDSKTKVNEKYILIVQFLVLRKINSRTLQLKNYMCQNVLTYFFSAIFSRFI